MWPTPSTFITFKDNKFVLDEKVARKLARINKELVVVCIAGTYRSGKSYLMNRLAGQSGFAMGSTVESVTRGIWAWYVDHPRDKNKGLLLMDTEGLDDPTRGDENYDMSILSMALLLSSTFIYNVVGRIDNRTVQNLQFIADISRHIRITTSDTTDADFDGVFPSFVLTIRDATLQLIIDGKEVDEDEYMEKIMLTQNSENTDSDKKQNEVKKKLRRYFPARKCFYFQRPAQNEDDLAILEKLDDSKLQKKFLAKSEEFCEYIFAQAPLKKIDRIQSVNGRIFVSLVRAYLRELNKGSTPCVDTAVKQIAKKEEELALKKCVAKYRESMLKSLTVPLNDEEFKTAHDRAHKRALSYFFKTVFLEDAENSIAKLRKRLYHEYKEVVRINAKNLVAEYYRILDELFLPIKKKIDNDIYLEWNGEELFHDDVDKLKRIYYSTTSRGIVVDDVWKTFAIDIILREEKLLCAKQKELDAKIAKERNTLRVNVKTTRQRAVEKQERWERQREVRKKQKTMYKNQEVTQRRELDQTASRDAQQRIELLQQSYEDLLNSYKKDLSRRVEELMQGYEIQMAARNREYERLVEEKSTQDAEQVREEMNNLTQESETKYKKYIKILANLGMKVGEFLINLPGGFKVAGGVILTVSAAAKLACEGKIGF